MCYVLCHLHLHIPSLRTHAVLRFPTRTDLHKRSIAGTNLALKKKKRFKCGTHAGPQRDIRLSDRVWYPVIVGK